MYWGLFRISLCSSSMSLNELETRHEFSLRKSYIPWLWRSSTRVSPLECMTNQRICWVLGSIVALIADTLPKESFLPNVFPMNQALHPGKLESNRSMSYMPSDMMIAAVDWASSSDGTTFSGSPGMCRKTVDSMCAAQLWPIRKSPLGFRGKRPPFSLCHRRTNSRNRRRS